MEGISGVGVACTREAELWDGEVEKTSFSAVVEVGSGTTEEALPLAEHKAFFSS